MIYLLLSLTFCLRVQIFLGRSLLLIDFFRGSDALSLDDSTIKDEVALVEIVWGIQDSALTKMSPITVLIWTIFSELCGPWTMMGPPLTAHCTSTNKQDGLA